MLCCAGHVGAVGTAALIFLAAESGERPSSRGGGSSKGLAPVEEVAGRCRRRVAAAGHQEHLAATASRQEVQWAVEAWTD